MSKMLPIEGATHVEVETTSGGFSRYYPGRDGHITVDSPQVRKWLRAEGLAVPANEGGTLVGRGAEFICPAGHRNYFKVCGRCSQEEVTDGTSER